MQNYPAPQALRHSNFLDFPSAVKEELDSYLAERHEAFSYLGASATDFFKQLRLANEGGKQFRASFSYWGWQTKQSQITAPNAGLIKLGAALELFQTAALLHDDVMDNSAMRRGKPTAHEVFKTQHQERGFSGSAKDYGRNIAILLGDLSLVLSESLFVASLTGLSEDRWLRCQRYYQAMRQEVSVGQFLDTYAQAQPIARPTAVSTELAEQVIQLKTAHYSVERPLVLGAAFAGGDTDELEELSTIGLKLGTVFQLRDDILGVFGSVTKTGKPSGDDLREGKRTPLLLAALQAADATALADLQSIVGNADASEAEITQVQRLIVNLGAKDEIESEINRLVKETLILLNQASLPEHAKTGLVSLLEKVAYRES